MAVAVPPAVAPDDDQSLSQTPFPPTATMTRRRRGGVASALCRAAVLSLSALFVAAQQPESTINSFNNLPARLFFFDDTEVSVVFL